MIQEANILHPTSYVRQILVGARTYIGHEDSSSVHPPPSPPLPLSIHPLYSPLSTLSQHSIYALKIRCLMGFNTCIELQLQKFLFKNITIIFMGSKSHKLNWLLFKKRLLGWIHNSLLDWIQILHNFW